MKTLIIGYGSIGRRHYDILSSMGYKISVLSKRELEIDRSYLNLNQAMETENPEYAVISNNTDDHIKIFLELKSLGFNGPVLIEKPLSVDIDDLSEGSFDNTYVAYNMRFNPLLERLKQEIEGEKVLSVVAYAGQYLPLWHKEDDYRNIYSSTKSKGGGVLRDFSHELDFICWLFGKWKVVTAIGGKFSSLEIDVEDTFSIMLETEDCCSIMLHINYLEKTPRRSLIVNTDKHTYEINFIDKSFKRDSDIDRFDFDRNYSYKLQHEAIISNDHSNLCTYEFAKQTLNLISAVERSSSQDPRIWIKNE